MNKEFIKALDEIEKEKGIKKEEIITAVEKALEKSFEENFDSTNVEISINEETGDTKVLAVKEVVEEVTYPNNQITLDEALEHNKRAKVGKEIKIKVTPKNFARVAAQKARNIVIQYIRDAERKVIYESYIDKEKDIINGMIQRVDYKNIYVDLGKSEGYIPEKEQVEGETFKPGDRVKLYVKEVKETSKGAQIILSRKAPEFVAKLFEIEVPEISQGTVEIMSISREAGYRTKIAVYAEDSSIDPVGACVGMKGARVNSIVEEINGEKIDIVVWSKDMKVYISNALSPAEVVDVYIDSDKKEAVAFVPDSQLSLAIGKEGQNVRLAAKLTNWKIDIKPESKKDEVLKELEELKLSEKENSDNEISDLNENILENEDIQEEIVLDEINE
ncbi:MULTISPECIES: transcription termination factor NusA [Helcococcus]|uniref:Transcription termination/antitermination protein NusA n=1 Tax=Helcococcus bovis TaxID=3153252 RepID=A0ABW9F6E1_9FIRM